MNRTTIKKPGTAPRHREAARCSCAPSEPTASVITRMTFHATPERTWRALTFYEQIGGNPPFLLSLLLPIPIGSEGPQFEAGHQARCLYQGGSLLKRATCVEAGVRYQFKVEEQDLEFGGGVRVLGGGFALRRLPGDRTEVELETRYTGGRRPHGLWRPLEAVVCHAFHRRILRVMRQKAEGFERSAGR